MSATGTALHASVVLIRLIRWLSNKAKFAWQLCSAPYVIARVDFGLSPTAVEQAVKTIPFATKTEPSQTHRRAQGAMSRCKMWEQSETTPVGPRRCAFSTLTGLTTRTGQHVRTLVVLP